MDEQRFLTLMEKALNAVPGSIRLADRLEDVEGWDSLGALAVIAVMDEHYGVALDAGVLVACQTVGDLCQAAVARRRAA